ncbi:MAG: LytR C-terminal domain-containing protein [Bifidobacteriaceae bacterium]|jgi:hypothetical protein|nr:LytR C-terminal domain-containing protein [Bifidobacteriaceae bacterium]
MTDKNPEERRQRNLRIRQVTVYTLLIGLLLVAGGGALGMWTGHLDIPGKATFKYKPSSSPKALNVPCPTAPDQVYPPTSAVPVHVLNGTRRSGLASATADDLAAHGFASPDAADTAPYDGVVKLTTGVQGVNGAYTLLQYMPEGAELTLDKREDTSVDVILGAEFTSLPTAEQMTFDSAAPIKPIEFCQAPAALLNQLGTK